MFLNQVLMFCKTFAVVSSISSILTVSAGFGTWAPEMTCPYEAPLRNCESPDMIPGEYIVYLKRGYSLEQHEETIGIDLSSSVEGTFPEDSRHGFIYGGKLSDAVLEAVRNDAGVNFVECDLKPEPAVVLAVDDL